MSAAGAVGWVPQQPALYGKLSVAENLRLFARLDRVRRRRGRRSTRMLAETASKIARTSRSRGSRAATASASTSRSACSPSPPVLLLDEPSAALDPRQRERLWRFIGALAERGTTVVYSTHVVSEAERYATRVLVLADGERLFWGTPAELRADDPDGGGEAASGGHADFEAAFVSFLRQRGH